MDLRKLEYIEWISKTAKEKKMSVAGILPSNSQMLNINGIKNKKKI